MFWGLIFGRVFGLVYREPTFGILQHVKNEYLILLPFITIPLLIAYCYRFICSAPDRIVKSSGGGHMRDTAFKLIHNDMPLYFPCPCRSAKPLQLAQLMRAYIVTPDSQFGIRINPRVQPGDNRTAPVFIPGPKYGIALPKNSFFVLRFPYVYMDETGPYLPPIDSQSLLNFRLLKDMYSFEA